MTQNYHFYNLRHLKLYGSNFQWFRRHLILPKTFLHLQPNKNKRHFTILKPISEENTSDNKLWDSDTHCIIITSPEYKPYASLRFFLTFFIPLWLLIFVWCFFISVRYLTRKWRYITYGIDMRYVCSFLFTVINVWLHIL